MQAYIGVLFTTYRRTDTAIRTILGIRNHLKSGPELVWYLADDGSEEPHTAACWNALEGAVLASAHSERMSVGAGMNKGVSSLLRSTDLILTLEDDWELPQDFDISPYVDLLEREPSIGMVRLGGLPVGLDLRSVGYFGRHYLEVQKTTQYAFSGNPSLRHRRFFEAYGPYPVGLTPGETEIVYDAVIRAAPGPTIVWPVEIGGWGPFSHIGMQRYEEYAHEL